MSEGNKIAFRCWTQVQILRYFKEIIKGKLAVNRQEQILILVHKIIKQRGGNSLEAIKLRQDRPSALSRVILDASYFKNK
jgi:hypothetical protein